MTRVAPAWRDAVTSDGGVLPAILWPSSVRSLRPARAPSSADACISGSYRLPDGVRACLPRARDRAGVVAGEAAVSFFFFMSPDRGEIACAHWPGGPQARALVRCLNKHHTRQMIACR